MVRRAVRNFNGKTDILDEFMKPGEFAKELSDTDGLRYDPKTRAPTEVGL